jgi:hypothetical protein
MLERQTVFGLEKLWETVWGFQDCKLVQTLVHQKEQMWVLE